MSFSWLGMLVRSAVAAMDFNFNVNRKSKISTAGKPMYKIKVFLIDHIFKISL